MSPKIYIITEGKFEAEVLQKLLAYKKKQIEILYSVGYSSALSKARSLMFEVDNPILTIIDAETTDHFKIQQKIDFITRYIGNSKVHPRFLIRLIPPEFEIIFTNSRAIFEKVINKKVSADTWKAASFSPKRALESHNPNYKNDILKYLDSEGFRKLLTNDPLIKEVNAFIDLMKESSFRLTNSNPIKKFSMATPSDYLTITRMTINSLSGQKPDEWSGNLMRQDLYMEITCSNLSKRTIRYPIYHFNSHVSPYHLQPVFEEHIRIPREEDLNGNLTEIQIRIAGVEIETPFEVQFTYSATPGIKEG